MKYEVVYTEKSLRQLQGIYNYIANDLLAPDAANSIVDKIMTAVEKLDEMPLRFPLYKKLPWKNRGLRKLNIENFTAFYFAFEEKSQVVIVAVMYGRRDIDNALDSEQSQADM